MDGPITPALAAWNRGFPVIVTVEEQGKVRGDMMLAAQLVRPETVNLLLLHAHGVLSMAVGEEIYRQLDLRAERPGQPNPDAPRAVTTIDAADGISTGISAGDRARTIAAAVHPDAEPKDVVQPGHVPVLLAAAGGVLERPRSVEAAVALSRLAGQRPAGVLSEVLDPTGELAALDELERISGKLDVPLLSVAALATSDAGGAT